MQKILIVDDNQNNRMLLRALLEDYEEENTIPLFIDEAVNGVEAVAMAAETEYDMILMDIMMPEMDGIEATRQIRANNSKVMIVAVSAVDDSARQKEILGCGAEDYISKPIKADVFRARLGNYFTLIHSRHTVPKRFNPSPANLFSSEIFSRKLLFYIQNDDELSEYWEYYLLNPEVGYEELSAAVRTLFSIGSIGNKLKLKLQLITEEGDDFFYMTMVGIDQIDEKIVKLILIKNSDVRDYKIEGAKISVRIPKVVKTAPTTVPLKDGMPEPVAANVPVAAYVAQDQVVQVYTYMDKEDLENIKEHLSDLDSLLLLVGNGDIQYEEVEGIVSNLMRIGKVAKLYTESYTIGHALSDLALAITPHIDTFIHKSRELGPLCAAFSRDLGSWLRLIFHEGASALILWMIRFRPMPG
ncbi:MAG: response regulator [Sulfuricurvum sp.]|jgi:CheY-like chemotaxis protein|uniref:response regulator n=1 Tax=Sulfuricurvum sp. TaxID=2025608 RepID=UPI0025D73208|nr:response regulator [Sulfuricurvum sp.]MCK9371838.1 response regulator [Sulfuricurvum sp.]